MRRENGRRQLRASAGEGDAGAVLEAAGFTVIDRQVTVRFRMTLDGEEVEVHNRCDLVAERDGRVFVVDVKTGARATDPTGPATRRQLLEYLLSHEADGALLVDMDARVVVEVAFPDLAPR